MDCRLFMVIKGEIRAVKIKLGTKQVQMTIHEIKPVIFTDLFGSLLSGNLFCQERINHSRLLNIKTPLPIQISNDHRFFMWKFGSNSADLPTKNYLSRHEPPSSSGGPPPQKKLKLIFHIKTHIILCFLTIVYHF